MAASESLLSTGLKKGFAGETQFQTTQRAGFSLQSSHLEESGNTYHDEWAKADRITGGQELVKVGEKIYTRVYAGGTISIEAMEKLGITKKDVMEFLIKCLNAFAESTRLHENFGPHREGNWLYQYKVLEKNDAIPMTTGREEIAYQGQMVFVHAFVMCPVE